MKPKFVMIVEPKGLYGADIADNLEPLKIEAIVQENETGKVFFVVEGMGFVEPDFDFTGSLEALAAFRAETTAGE